MPPAGQSRLQSSAANDEPSHTRGAANDEPSHTRGADRDWYWIRRAVAGTVVLGAPLVLLQQLRTEVWVRQAVEDAGYSGALAAVRAAAPWLDLPLDGGHEYAHVVHSEAGGAEPSSSALLSLPPIGMIALPSYGGAVLESRLELVGRIAGLRARASSGAAEGGISLAADAIRSAAAAEATEAGRLERLLARTEGAGSWAPSMAADGPAGPFAPYPRSGAPCAGVMEACAHLDEEAEAHADVIGSGWVGWVGSAAPSAARRVRVASDAEEERARLRVATAIPRT
jgi:hypothetical protein